MISHRTTFSRGLISCREEGEDSGLGGFEAVFVPGEIIIPQTETNVKRFQKNCLSNLVAVDGILSHVHCYFITHRKLTMTWNPNFR